MNNNNSYIPKDYIGLSIKSDEFIEVLEAYDLKVIYDYDRTHENMDDVYWIHDYDNGCTFQANQDQIVVVAFIYLRALEDHKAFHWLISGITIDKNEIKELGNPTKTGTYKGQSWVRYDEKNISTHYSWDAMGPRMLTFSHLSRVPK